MTPKAFCSAGNAEGVKLAAHAVLGTATAVCAVYNLAAFYYRREPHLAVNSVVYLLATGWEAVKVQHHLHSWESQ